MSGQLKFLPPDLEDDTQLVMTRKAICFRRARGCEDFGYHHEVSLTGVSTESGKHLFSLNWLNMKQDYGFNAIRLFVGDQRFSSQDIAPFSDSCVSILLDCDASKVTLYVEKALAQPHALEDILCDMHSNKRPKLGDSKEEDNPEWYLQKMSKDGTKFDGGWYRTFDYSGPPFMRIAMASGLDNIVTIVDPEQTRAYSHGLFEKPCTRYK